MTVTQRRMTVDTLAAMLDVIEVGIEKAKEGGDATFAIEEVTALGNICLAQHIPEYAMSATG